MTDNLSKTFQKQMMSAVGGRNLAELNINTLKKYEKQWSSSPLFWDNGTAWKVSKYGVISGPYFPAFGLNTEI